MNYALSQTVALWVIAALWLISVVCIVVGIMYIVRFLQEAAQLFRKVENTVDDMRSHLYPVLEDSRKTLDEVRKTTVKISELSSKVDKIVNSLSAFGTAARFVSGLMPVKGRGLIGGIFNGINLFKLLTSGGKNKNE